MAPHYSIVTARAVSGGGSVAQEEDAPATVNPAHSCPLPTCYPQCRLRHIKLQCFQHQGSQWRLQSSLRRGCANACDGGSCKIESADSASSAPRRCGTAEQSPPCATHIWIAICHTVSPLRCWYQEALSVSGMGPMRPRGASPGCRTHANIRMNMIRNKHCVCNSLASRPASV